MFKRVSEKLISTIDENASEKSLILLQGFPVSFVQGICENYGDREVIEDFINENGKYDSSKILKNRRELVTSILSLHEKIVVLPYEVAYPVSKVINFNILDRKIFVIRNDLLDEYPNTINIAVSDIEEKIDETSFTEVQNFNEFFSYSQKIQGKFYVSYPDLDPEVNFEKKFFSSFLGTEFPEVKNFDQISKFKQVDIETVDFLEIRRQIFLGDSPGDIAITINPNDDIGQYDRTLKALKILYSMSEFDLEIAYKRGELEPDYRPEIKELLKYHWGSEEFRSIKFYTDPAINTETKLISQGSIIENIISQTENAKKEKLYRDIFLTAPTGSGKSILYQIPALYLEKNYNYVTIIISPLIALMEDQVNGLKDNKVYTSTYINSSLSLHERTQRLEAIKDGHISILYLSPELLLSYQIEHFIGDRELGLLVVDEAHLVTTWGRDFRVDYWFLGNYIRKLRNRLKRRFPVVAVTATAAYQGPDDLVFQTVESLNMQMRDLYIGLARRDDISFDIDQVKYSSYEEERLERTINKIKKLVDQDVKALVYFPWVSQIKKVYNSLENTYREKVDIFHGSAEKERKKRILKQFKGDDLKVVLASKAFGMGVDISDIEIVYHHAPSGNLSDYIQEVGRVARKDSIQGIAEVDYSTDDLKYAKILYGLSSIYQWQVKATLKKLYKIYQNKNSRNFLVSIDDFSHIFDSNNPDDDERKVKSALLLVEQDLVKKFNYPVIIVRPKSLFSEVFCHVSSKAVQSFENKYSPFVEERININRKQSFKISNGTKTIEDNRTIYKLKLNELWEERFQNQSFPQIKYEYYTTELFEELSEHVNPCNKLSITLDLSPQETYTKICDYLDDLEEVFFSFGNSFFSKNELDDKLSAKIIDKNLRNDIIDLMIAVFSSSRVKTTKGGDSFEDELCFLQKRRFADDEKFKTVTNSYSNIKDKVKRQYYKMFIGQKSKSYTDYISIDMNKSKLHHQVAYIIEALALGTFEVTGGDYPLLFIRINDPSKIKFLSDTNYTNEIVEDIARRHESSLRIMEEFFTKEMSSEERWDYVEDYFLGKIADTKAF